ncbi:MAG: NB-ARC domain-containing protein [Cyanobacteria bacterium J06634_6]
MSISPDFDENSDDQQNEEDRQSNWLENPNTDESSENTGNGQEDQSLDLPAENDDKELGDKRNSTYGYIEGSENVVISGEKNQFNKISAQNVYFDPSASTPSCRPSQAPYLPDYFVDRKRHLQSLKKLLLEDTENALVISAIYGLGGIGKTVLASALAKEVESHFYDGILWTSLGKQPDLTSLLMGWIEGLGDCNFKLIGSDAVKMATLHLRSLLRNKKVLLVVDDVWEVEHLKPFLVGGPDCRLLFTTRRANVADDIDVVPYQLGVMSEAESLQLLENALNCPLEEPDAATAKAVVKLVGYLPLALNLIAARLRKGLSLVRIKQDVINNINLLEKASRPRSSDKSLEAVFNSSLNPLKEDFPKTWKSFVWLGLLQEDALITVPMAAHLWQVDREEAADRLDLLWNDSLLMQDASVGINKTQELTYRIHDLLRDKARRLISDAQVPGIGSTLLEAQAHFLQRYRSYTTQQLWHTLPDDGYIHQALSWHMAEAGQSELIHELLKEETESNQNGWYQACEELSMPNVFVRDLKRAWTLTNLSYTQNQAQSLALSFRYALIQSSLNSLTANIPPSLMMALVKHGHWSSRQALIYVRQLQNEEAQTEAIEALAPYVASTLPSEVLAIVHNIKTVHRRAHALIALIPHIPTEQIPKVLTISRDIQSAQYRVEVLTALIPHLPETVSEALTVACEISHERLRFSVLLTLIPHLSTNLLPKALKITQGFDDTFYRDKVLTALIPYLPVSLLPKALTTARDNQNMNPQAQYCTHALIALIPYFPEIASEALLFTRQIKSSYDRAQSLTALVSFLSEVDCLTEVIPFTEVVYEALVAIRDSIFDQPCCEALITLIPYLSFELFSMALTIPKGSANLHYRTKAFTTLIPHLPFELLPTALITAKEIQSKDDRTKALTTLIPYIPEAANDILTFARSIKDLVCKTQLLIALIPYLPTQLLLTVIQEIQSADYRAQVLTALIPYFPDAASEALMATRDISDRYTNSQVKAFIALIPYFPEAATEALIVARNLKDIEARLSALIDLIPHIPELAAEALTLISDLHFSEMRSQALTILLPLLPVDLLPQALAISGYIRDTHCLTEALSTLIPYLPEVAPQALRIAQDIKHPEQRTYALIPLIPALPATASEALDSVSEIKYFGNRGHALRVLIPELPVSLLTPALAFACNERHDKAVDKALSALIPYLPEVASETLVAARNIKDAHYRAKILTTLIPYLPEVASEALATAWKVNHVMSRDNHIIALIPHLPTDQLPKVLTAVRDIQSDQVRAKALTALIPYSPEVTSEALLAARSIEGARVRTKLLTALIPHLPEVTSEALLAARSIEGAQSRAEAFTALIPYSPHAVFEALTSTRDIHRISERTNAAATLIPHLSADLLPKTLAETREIKDDYSRTYILIALIPHLPGAASEALMMIQNTQNECDEYRTETLSALIPYLPTDLLFKAMVVVQDIQDANARAHLLISLIPRLPAAVPEALAAAQKIHSWQDRARAFTLLLPHLPAELLTTSLAAVLETKNEHRKTESLSNANYARKFKIENMQLKNNLLLSLIHQHSTFTRPNDFYLYLQTILQDGFGHDSRGYLLSVFPELEPIFSKLGDPDIWPLIHQSMQDICRQWP